MIDGDIEGMKKEYVKYLLALKELEEEVGDMGRWPSFNEFQVIYEEEFDTIN